MSDTYRLNITMKNGHVLHVGLPGDLTSAMRAAEDVYVSRYQDLEGITITQDNGPLLGEGIHWEWTARDGVTHPAPTVQESLGYGHGV